MSTQKKLKSQEYNDIRVTMHAGGASFMPENVEAKRIYCKCSNGKIMYSRSNLRMHLS